MAQEHQVVGLVTIPDPDPVILYAQAFDSEVDQPLYEGEIIVAEFLAGEIRASSIEGEFELPTYDAEVTGIVFDSEVT